MSFTTGRKTGSFHGWHSRIINNRRPKAKAGRRLCTLRFELLERRDLLTATVVVGTQVFLQDIPTISTGGIAQQGGGNPFTSNPCNITSGSSIDYSSATMGSFTGALSGQGNFNATIPNMAIDGQNVSGLNVSGLVDVTSPSSDASMVTATGTLNTE